MLALLRLREGKVVGSSNATACHCDVEPAPLRSALLCYALVVVRCRPLRGAKIGFAVCRVRRSCIVSISTSQFGEGRVGKCVPAVDVKA